MSAEGAKEVEIVAVLLSFVSIMVLIFKKVNMGLSLLLGALIAGLLLPFTIKEMLQVILEGMISPLSLELLVLVGFISGLGFIMKSTGDLDLLVDSLINIFKNATLLSILMPALIGTIQVPGGAILSAPMVKESGDKLGLTPAQQTVINVFFRHIGFFIYPLYSSLIITTQLLDIEKITIIKYNLPIVLSGIITAILFLFRGAKRGKRMERVNNGFLWSLFNFFRGFFPILLILSLALVFRVSFPLAVILGVVVALLKNPPKNPLPIYKERVVNFFKKGVSYQFLLVILGVMSYKAIIEESGAIFSLTQMLLDLGFSLPLLILLLGLITPVVMGVHMAATGILVPLIAPFLAPESMGPYVSFLVSTIILGYLVSPLHLCLVLSKEYFQVSLWSVYRLFALPFFAMLLTGLLQILLFAR